MPGPETPGARVRGVGPVPASVAPAAGVAVVGVVRRSAWTAGGLRTSAREVCGACGEAARAAGPPVGAPYMSMPGRRSAPGADSAQGAGLVSGGRASCGSRESSGICRYGLVAGFGGRCGELGE
ncbi:hypothetical protein SALBM311S_13102 [Streptomyces alboniger]